MVFLKLYKTGARTLYNQQQLQELEEKVSSRIASKRIEDMASKTMSKATPGSLSVVIDNGSYAVKAGFGGGSEPKAVFNNLIGSDDEVSNEYS